MANWTSGIIKANEVNLHYRRTGGDKTSIVLLHGLMLSGACWTPLARSLEQDYDLLMPDSRGHGNSSAPKCGYNYVELAADVIGLIDSLRLETPVLLGHSMGGMTAALVAHQNPKRLRGLILADPTFLTEERQREVYESDLVDQHRQIIKLTREDLMAEMERRNGHRSKEIIQIFAEARFQTKVEAFEILKPPNPDYRLLVKNLQIPSLLIIGDRKAVVSLKMAQELASLNPLLKVEQIENAGHAVPYDQPERFSAVVRTFLDALK